MKILMTSYVFWPSVGGIEVNSCILAEEFCKAGHSVCVLTDTELVGAEPDAAYHVVRQPTASQIWSESQSSDVVFQNHPSTRLGWPVLLGRTPSVVAVRTWIPHGSIRGRIRWWFMIRLFRRSACIANSLAIAGSLPVSATVIGNPYRDEVFKVIPAIQRELKLLFVGRLVSDKGADLLIEALVLLKKKGLEPGLTMAGEGPEADQLQERVLNEGLNDQVQFRGALIAEDLAVEMNHHEILVVPSRWCEPFGNVALEGIACGCVVIGSEGGGLPDAIGPCGRLFPNGDAAALSKVLHEVLQSVDLRDQLRSKAPEHLARHTRKQVAQRYLDIIERAVA